MELNFYAKRRLPVDNLLGVKKFQPKNDTRSVESSTVFWEDALLDVQHQITAWRVVHHEHHMLLHKVEV